VLDLTAELSPDPHRAGVSPEWEDPARYWPRLSAATAHLPAPVAVIDRDALRYNAMDMLVRAGGLPIRVASKSVRVRAVLDAVLALPGYRGILAFTLAEALWLAETHDDIVIGYPTVDRAALARLFADEQAARRVTLMVDDPAHLDFIDSVAGPGHRPEVRVAIDVDASWRSARERAWTRRMSGASDPASSPCPAIWASYICNPTSRNPGRAATSRANAATSPALKRAERRTPM